MSRCFVPAIGVASAIAFAAISVEPTLGQTNIDQGKPASELFANYCAVCHKSTRGLANGRNSLTLSFFLREHYAASSQQAAALAAYVIGAGGNAPAAKPDQRVRSEEPKGQEPKGQETRGQQTRGQDTRGQDTRGQDTRGQDTKPQEPKPRAASVSPKSEPEKPAGAGEPGHAAERGPAVEPVHEERSGQQESTGTAPAAGAPSSTAQAPELRSTTSAGVSAESNDGAPVPRDNIPD